MVEDALEDARTDAVARRNAFDRLVRELVAGEPAWMGWFGPNAPPPPAPAAAPTFRGDAPRPRATEAVVRVALFDDPYAGKGGAALFELRLMSDGERPGDPLLRLELRPTNAGDSHPEGWSGPTTGRLLVGGTAYDFDGYHGSRLDQRADTLVLEARLGHAWIDRDETHAELLAALDELLLLREPL